MKIMLFSKNQLFAQTCLIIWLLCFGFNCKKEVKNYSVIYTSEIKGITYQTAESGGNITVEGSSSVTSRGVCWNTTINPTVNDYKTIDGSGIGSFKSTLTGLLPNTTYFVRAYSINSYGVSYGNQMEFTTGDSPPVAPCSPPKNSILLNGEVYYFRNFYVDTVNLNYGKYEISASAFDAEMIITFAEKPQTGRYITAGRDLVGKECFVNCYWGNYFVGKSGDTVYVNEFNDGSYTIEFCKVAFSSPSASNNLKFKSDMNLIVK